MSGRRVVRTIAVVLAGVLLLGGCGLGRSASGSVPGAAASSEPAPPPLPPRPRDLPIDSLDPCDLLTAQQAADLVAGKPKRMVTPDAAGGRYPLCYWQHAADEPDQAYSTVLNLEHPANEALWSVRPLEVVTVGGFPAVETQTITQQQDRSCTEFIDVAPKGRLEVTYFYNGYKQKFTRDRACAKAREAAQIVMQNLTARFPG